MPADNPLVGETWEMVDPVTGEAAQAVVSEIDDGAVRLIARLGRRLAMPRRSFLMTWHFVQEAPGHVCAHGTCDNPAFLRVDDLGTWVMVCPDHLPAWVQPLLPTDDPESNSLDRCPMCRASTHGSGSNVHEVDGVLIQHCGSCDCYWVALASSSEEDDPIVATLEHGIQLVEAIANTAPLLEQRGLLAQGNAGAVAWSRLTHTLDAEVSGNEMSVQGVKVRLVPQLGEFLVLVGSRPKTGVQRLGGTPGRQAPTGTVLGVPERGSFWTNIDDHAQVRVVDVQISEVANGPGQRMTVKAHTTTMPSKEIELGLQEFLGRFQQRVSDQSTERRRPPEPPPCDVGDEYISPENAHVEVSEVTTNSVVVKHEHGGLQTLPTYIFSTRYRKAPPRRSVYQRLMDDDEES